MRLNDWSQCTQYCHDKIKKASDPMVFNTTGDKSY